MTATLTRELRPGGDPGPLGPDSDRPFGPPRPVGRDDMWPHTSRWLPWMLAGFLVMLWLVPFDGASARINLPVDGKLDRFAILAIALCWFMAVITGGRATPRWRPSAVDLALLGFIAVSLLSIVLDSGALSKVGDLTLALKQFSLLLSWAFFFFFASTTLRPAEVPRFIRLFVGLSLITATGVLYERYTGANLFFNWAHYYLPGGVFSLTNTGIGFTQQNVSGPTLHPLAMAAMFSMALPFPLVAGLQTRALGRKMLHFGAAALLMWATFATGRRTGDYALVATLLALVIARPRQILRLVPLIVLGITVAFLIKPNGVKLQIRHLSPSTLHQGASSLHRTVTYPAIVPDTHAHMIFGRGYGSYDPHKYRILDNQVLGLLIEVGLLGLGSFAAILIAVAATAWRALRSHDPARITTGLASFAATAAFATTLPLFDALGYPQDPYLFLFLAALVVASRPVPGAGAAAAIAAAGERAANATEMLRRRRLTRPIPRRGFEETPARRRIGMPLRRPPVGAPHPVAESLPGPVAHPPAGRRRRAAAGAAGAFARARRGTADFARNRAGKTLAVILTLGLAVALFGRGGGGGGTGSQQALLGQANGNANNPFAAAATSNQGSVAGERIKRKVARRAAGGAPAPTFVSYSAPSTSTPSSTIPVTTPPASTAPSHPSAPTKPPVKRSQRKHHKSHKPGGSPSGSKPTTPQGSNPNSCLPQSTPVIVEQVLQTANVNVCNPGRGALDGSATARLHAVDARLRAAVAAGKLTKAQYETMIADIARAYGFTVTTTSPSSSTGASTASASATGAVTSKLP